jgi:hypothetical protein
MRIMRIIITVDFLGDAHDLAKGDQYSRSIPVETTVIQDKITSKKFEVVGESSWNLDG